MLECKDHGENIFLLLLQSTKCILFTLSNRSMYKFCFITTNSDQLFVILKKLVISNSQQWRFPSRILQKNCVHNFGDYFVIA